MKSVPEYLHDYAETDDRTVHRRIESVLWTKYGEIKAILVLDMSGFTRITETYGVVYYLSLIQKMKEIVTPVLLKNSGEILEYHADNCFAKFAKVEQAITTAREIITAIQTYNDKRKADENIGVCFGIDFGSILCFENGHFAGGPVNRASRLGEDTAGPWEILITKEAAEEISDETPLNLEGYSGSELPNNLKVLKVLE